MPFSPESPVYLQSQGKLTEASKAYEYYGIAFDSSEKTENKADSSAQLKFSDPIFYKPLGVAAVMMLSQQLCGINAIFYYSTGIFEKAGLDNGPLSTVYVGIVNVVFTFVRWYIQIPKIYTCEFWEVNFYFLSLFLIDRYGRKILHLVGLSGMLVMTILLGVLLEQDTSIKVSFKLSKLLFGFQDPVSWLSNHKIYIKAIGTSTLVFTLMFVAFFQSGPGSIPWFISAELFDETNRSRAMAIAASFWVQFYLF